jgi:hypothetical protein
MKKSKWVIEISVSNFWIEDGFNLTKDNINDMLQKLLPYACSNEITGKILNAPDKSTIKKIQGE